MEVGFEDFGYGFRGLDYGGGLWFCFVFVFVFCLQWVVVATVVVVADDGGGYG